MLAKRPRDFLSCFNGNFEKLLIWTNRIFSGFFVSRKKCNGFSYFFLQLCTDLSCTFDSMSFELDYFFARWNFVPREFPRFAQRGQDD